MHAKTAHIPNTINITGNYLNMGTRKSRCTKRLLSFIKQFPLWYAQYEGCLVTCSSHGSNPITILPSTVDSFTWIQKVNLHNLASSNGKQIQQSAFKTFIQYRIPKISGERFIYLIRIPRIPGHDDTPAAASSSH